MKLISDEALAELGYTPEKFNGSRLELFLNALVESANIFLEKETERMMRSYGFTYGEARMIAIERLLGVGKND